MASISISNVTKTTASITVTADSSASRIWTLKLNGTVYNKTDKLSSRQSYTWEVSGLKPSTKYTAVGQYGPTTGLEYPSTTSSTTGSFTTLSPQTLPSGTASLTEVSKMPTSLKIKVDGITPYSNITRKFWWFLNGNEIKSKTVSGTATEDTYEFTGLSPRTTYTVRFEYKRTGDEYDTFYVSKSFTTYEKFATTDSASYEPTIKTTSGSILLYNITQRSYPRTARFHWYNTTTGNYGYKDETIPAYENSVKHDVTVYANTQYRFKIQILNLDNTITYDSGNFYRTTWSDTDDATPDFTVDGNTITMKLTNITPRSYVRWARFQLEDTTNAVKLNANTVEAEYTYKNLSFNTKYNIKFSVRNDDGGDNGDGGTRTFFKSDTATTESPNYTLSLSTSSTYNTITAIATVNKEQTYDLDLTVYLNGDRALEIDIPAGKKSREKTWETDITPATAYTIKLYDKLKKETVAELVRRTKNNFHWSDSQWNMNVTKGAKFYFNPDAWNEFANQLEAKAKYYGYTYEHAAVSKDSILTAVRYNGAVSVINTMVVDKKGDCKTKVALVNAGDPVTADCINILATCLNE